MKNKLAFIDGTETSYFDDRSGKQMVSKKTTWIDIDSKQVYYNVNLAPEILLSSLEQFKVYEGSVKMKAKVVNGYNALIPSEVSVSGNAVGYLEFKPQK